MRLAIDANLVTPDVSVFDYGCGRGDDLERLQEMGILAKGWDPVHQAASELLPSDVVNLGYVINVVEDQAEREKVLGTAWGLARRVLVISARLASDVHGGSYEPYLDGCLSGRKTFQKFYTQKELRDWIEQTLGERAFAAGPGVFFVFRDEQCRQAFVASRYRRRRSVPKLRKSDLLFEEHRELLEPLMGFVADRGRLPASWELGEASKITEVFGSLRRAFSVVRRVTGAEQWQDIRAERSEEVLIQLGLDRFGGRAKFTELPPDLQLDVREFFSSYRRACELADKLLFSAGSVELVDEQVRESCVGKVTGNALYVHRDALHRLQSVLRVYEGCARAYVGVVDGANIIKLHRRQPKISYLAYPDFDTDPHPALIGSLAVDLRSLDVAYRDYSSSDNPPVLHRKESFLTPDDHRYKRFARLTQQEERWGLCEDVHMIGTKQGWEAELSRAKARLKGHRLVKIKTET